MKRSKMAICMLFLSAFACAQEQKPVNPQKDKLEFEGYTIKLLPAPGGTYGYNILKGKDLVVHQSANPFTLSPVGLSKREDVYKIAKWQIRQLKEMNPAELQHGSQSYNGPSINQRIPRKIAAQLQIDMNF